MPICGDHKVTVNPMLEVDQHPLPLPEEIFASLSGGQKFTKVDLSHAYQQFMLLINTHKGLYRYTCLPFGVAFRSSDLPAGHGCRAARDSECYVLFG